MMLRTGVLVGCLIAATGCASTQEVETARPRAYEARDDVGPEAAQQARISVFLDRGTTELPEEVEQLQFRIADVRLRGRDGEWLRLPSDGAMIELERGRNASPRILLDTRVPPASYDSLAITLDRVFVRFNENAGAPLTTAKDAPQRFALRLEPTLEAPTALHLRLEPGPSLIRTDDCRWFFVPIFETELSRSSSTPQEH